MMSKERGVDGRLIHFGDCGSQPMIRIACDQSWYHPWQTDSTLPEEIFEAADEKMRLYTWNPRLVTCPECKKTGHWRYDYINSRRFDTRLKLLGLSGKEYAEYTKSTISYALGLKPWPADVKPHPEFENEYLDKIWMAEEDFEDEPLKI